MRSTDATRGRASLRAKAGWRQWLFAKFQGGSTDRYENEIAPRKRELFDGLAGDVLEIGPGGGPNLRYLAHDVRWFGVEPNPYMHDYLQAEATARGIDINAHLGTAEALPVADESMDAVVSTLVLCSVPDQAQVLNEILRVLRPGGRFIFVEHVAAPPDSGLRRVQNFVRPVWQFVGDGCQPNRETGTAIQNAGFATVHVDRFEMSVPIVKPHIAGCAVK